MTIIATVLKSGGDYRPEHVQELHSQFGDLPSLCFSDCPVAGVKTLPLKYGYRSWFSKMELFRPDAVAEDILYLDLDTWVIKNLDRYLCDTQFRMLSDFYHPQRPASGVMYIPHAFKTQVWQGWSRAPEAFMNLCRGDQEVLEQLCGRHVARFGAEVKSYKVHVARAGMAGFHALRSKGNGLIPQDTDILCFHGSNARPWMTPLIRPAPAQGTDLKPA